MQREILGTDGNDFKYLSSPLSNSTKLNIIRNLKLYKESTKWKGKEHSHLIWKLYTATESVHRSRRSTQSRFSRLGHGSPFLSCVHISQKVSKFRKGGQHFTLGYLKYQAPRVSKLKRQPPDWMNWRKTHTMACHHDSSKYREQNERVKELAVYGTKSSLE